MEIYYAKIIGKCNLPQRLEIGHNFQIKADCSVTSETRSDNDNGEFDVVFKIEPITMEIVKDNGEIIKAKDPRKNSVKFRNSCWRVSNDNQIDNELFYNFATVRCIGLLDSLADEFNKIKK